MDEVVQEAHDNWKLTNDREAFCRARFKDDFRFAHGDADNHFQWDDRDRNIRANDRRPALTINKTRQHNLTIINDARQNKPGIKYMPSGQGASYDSAQVWMALARRIEANSCASDAYLCGVENMVNGGFGYLRVTTDYVAPDSFEQEILIKRIPDPLKVFLDPNTVERAKADMKFGLILEDIPKKIFEKKYPKLAEKAKMGPFASGWVSDVSVRVAEYYRVEEEADTLWQVFSDSAPPFVAYQSQISDDLIRKWKADGFAARSRKTFRKKIAWYYIVGNDVEEDNIWPGIYIPIVPFIAEEVVIDNVLDRKSHTRALKDPQRMYNWWSSASIEFGALQTKTPWLAAAEAVEGFENDWEQANRQNKAVLFFNAFGEGGMQIPPPQRIEPPVAAPVAISGMEIAGREMEMVSGQYSAQMGAPGNERTGKAINERQRAGDRSTYHYIDAEAVAIRQVGLIILDTAPRIYEPGQIIQILGEDGKTQEIQIDPQMQESLRDEKDEDGEVIARFFNPNVGKYDIVADVGPGYATRREETFNALVLLLTQAPQLANVIGDLLFRAGDFMYADEAAKRLNRMVPPEALGKGPTQKEQMMMMQMQQLQQLLGKLQQENAEAKIKLKGRNEKRDVDIYNAFTQRLKVLQDQGLSQQEHALATVQLMRDMMNDSLDASQQSVDKALLGEEEKEFEAGAKNQLPSELPAGLPQGARQAPDGKHYVPDPMRPGKFLQVVPGGENAG